MEYDYNVWADDDSIDHWTSDLEQARIVAQYHTQRTGCHPNITRYPVKMGADGYTYTDTLSGDEHRITDR